MDGGKSERPPGLDRGIAEAYKKIRTVMEADLALARHDAILHSIPSSGLIAANCLAVCMHELGGAGCRAGATPPATAG